MKLFDGELLCLKKCADQLIVLTKGVIQFCGSDRKYSLREEKKKEKKEK